MDKCINGHEFTQTNTKFGRTGNYRVRKCITCINEGQNKRNNQKKKKING